MAKRTRSGKTAQGTSVKAPAKSPSPSIPPPTALSKPERSEGANEAAVRSADPPQGGGGDARRLRALRVAKGGHESALRLGAARLAQGNREGIREIWARFWAYEISWARWCTFRFTFFALLSVDAFLQLSHAPRYGAGGFNVQHLPGAPLPEPGRASVTFAHAAMCLLFALVAQGILTRVTLPLAALLYAWTYFSSQLDAYQHHYLVALLLFVLCFVPHTPDPILPTAAPHTPRRMTSWAIRLALVQVAIVYLWAAISKMTPLWLDGTALAIQITSDGTVRDISESLGFGTVAKLVLATELALAATVWWRPAWPFALAAGIGLHTGVELVGLDIGLFSYLMFAVYLLVIPDRFYVAAARGLGPELRRTAGLLSYRAGWVVAPLALVALYVTVPLPFGLPIALAFGLLAIAGVRGLRHAGWAFALAAAIPIAVNAATDTAEDYYRYWAGGARRMGDDAEARRAYLGLLEVDADSEYANFHLGNLEAAAGKLDGALRYYQRAERRSGVGRTRAFVAEAQIHLRQGDGGKARAALERARRIDPADPQAIRLLGVLDGSTAPPPAPSPAPTPDALDHD